MGGAKKRFARKSGVARGAANPVKIAPVPELSVIGGDDLASAFADDPVIAHAKHGGGFGAKLALGAKKMEVGPQSAAEHGHGPQIGHRAMKKADAGMMPAGER